MKKRMQNTVSKIVIDSTSLSPKTVITVNDEVIFDNSNTEQSDNE